MSMTKVMFGILLVFAFNYAVKQDLETAFKLGEVCVEYVKNVFLPTQAHPPTNWEKFCIKFGLMEEPQPQGSEWLRCFAIGLVIYVALTAMAFLYHSYGSWKLAKKHWRDHKDKPHWVKPIIDQKSQSNTSIATDSTHSTCQRQKSDQTNPVHTPSFADSSTQTTDARHQNPVHTPSFADSSTQTTDARHQNPVHTPSFADSSTQTTDARHQNPVHTPSFADSSTQTTDARHQNPVHTPSFADSSTQTTDARHANAIINFQSAELITLDKKFLLSKQASDRMSSSMMSQEYIMIQQEDNTMELENKCFVFFVVAVVGVLHMLYHFCWFMYPLLREYIF